MRVNPASGDTNFSKSNWRGIFSRLFQFFHACGNAKTPAEIGGGCYACSGNCATCTRVGPVYCTKCASGYYIYAGYGMYGNPTPFMCCDASGVTNSSNCHYPNY